jgi:hypothetical protein
MKKEILKIAGVKNEKEFYSKFPSEESFMAKYGKEFKKALLGKSIKKAPDGVDIPSAYQSEYEEWISSNKGSGNPAAVQDTGDKLNKITDAIGKYSGPISNVISGIKSLGQEQKQLASAKQWRDVSKVALNASRTRPEQVERKYVRPEDIQNTGAEYFPVYGTGTNILAKDGALLNKVGGNPGEIQNTFAPNDLYQDLGYEPLNDSTKMKAFNYGGKLESAEFGFSDIVTRFGPSASHISDILSANNAGSSIGGGIGEAVGSAIPIIGSTVGKIGGQLIGGLLDRKPQQTKKAKAITQQNVNLMGVNQQGEELQNQYSSFMEDGGTMSPYKWVSHDWNPQVISKFGNVDMQDLNKIATEGMNTLRTGGHIRANYMYPQDQFAMGGELETHWGGHAEPISYNPYLPEEGETVMFKGNSHDESDGRGNTGIGVTYGKNPVEVEGGEPAVKLQDGENGDDNLVVFGNLPIHNSYISLLDDENAKGKKFKNYVADLSKIESRQNKIIENSTDKLNDLTPITSIDKLELSSHKANIMGANMRLKDIAEKKQNAAHLQQAINDTAEENGYIAEELAKGKIKRAANGISAPKEVIDPSLMRTKMLPIPQESERAKTKFPWESVINEILPYIRPSNTESLDPQQLAGEMYALSSNQLEPVQAQTYSPELGVPYDISLQDTLNENIADYNAASRTAGYNPAAQAMLNAQKYKANQQVLGEQFRLNQAEKDKVYTQNRELLNQSKLTNLGILDKQYERQAGAKSATKATTLAALNSISDKYLKNKLENRTLQTYENLYNYRYDAEGRAINMNPLAEFNLSGKPGRGKEVLPAGYEYIYNEEGQPIDIRKSAATKKAISKSSRNGAIVKSAKDL